MRLRRTLVTLLVAAAPLGGALVACGESTGGDDEYVSATVAEDCSWPEDQDNREDDCGYWTKNGEHRVGAQPDSTWLWIWYSWVTVGRTSVPPAGWKPPKGIKFPTRTVRVNRKNCALAFGGALVVAPGPISPARPAVQPPPAPPRPAPAQPARPNVNKPPANQPQNNRPQVPRGPVYKPPTGQKVSC